MNPTFQSSVFGSGPAPGPIPGGPMTGSNQASSSQRVANMQTYQSSVFADNSPKRNVATRPTSSGVTRTTNNIFTEPQPGLNEPTSMHAWFGKGKKTEESCRSEFTGYVRSVDKDKLQSELLSSDGHAAPCHRRKPFADARYQSNIRTLGADEMPNVETKLDRHLVSDGVKGSLRMSASPLRGERQAAQQAAAVREPIDIAPSFSEDSMTSIYPNATSIHKKRTVKHEHTPYAHSEEFTMLKQEVRDFNDGVPPSMLSGSYAAGGADPSPSLRGVPHGYQDYYNPNLVERSTLLDHNPTRSSAPVESESSKTGKKLIPQPERLQGNPDALMHVGHGLGSGPEAVPRKNYHLMVHQAPLRGDYSRQVITRYEQSPASKGQQDLFH
ncbi:unnamed protein product [Amoebophrya sp. A120]|nr:unnamed protein product [Amoebophrya sp. A120]|eukprot:GSA120T00011888001.1